MSNEMPGDWTPKKCLAVGVAWAMFFVGLGSCCAIVDHDAKTPLIQIHCERKP